MEPGRNEVKETVGSEGKTAFEYHRRQHAAFA